MDNRLNIPRLGGFSVPSGVKRSLRNLPIFTLSSFGLPVLDDKGTLRPPR